MKNYNPKLRFPNTDDSPSYVRTYQPTLNRIGVSIYPGSTQTGDTKRKLIMKDST